MTAPSTERIEVDDEQALNAWAAKLNASPEQIRDAVAKVGNHPEDVELHLKGSRASTNSERVAEETRGN